MQKAAIAGVILATCWSAPGSAEVYPRATSIERYGLGGHIQPVGLFHGFHIETVAIDSPADRDGFRAEDVIVKVDGEAIRSLDHLRAILADVYADDGNVSIVYTRGKSLEHHVVTGHLKPSKDRREDSRDEPPRKTDRKKSRRD